MNNIKGDIIQDLPTDKSVPSHNEIQIVDTLFKEKQKIANTFLYHTKDLLILLILFIMFSFKQIDDLVGKFIPIVKKSPYISVIFRGLCFVLAYFIINNLHLVIKK